MLLAVHRFSFRALVSLALGVASASSGAHAALPPTIIAKNQNVVLFQASITAATRDQLFALLDDSVNTVVVNSSGGDPMAAIDIGREIRRRNLRVGVLGVCVSACAHFVFVPAKQRQVSPDSLVVFHTTSSSLFKMIENGKVPAATRDRMAAQAKAEKAFYDEIGVSNRLLLAPQVQIQTVCYRYNDPPENSDRDVTYRSRFTGWTPTKEFMEAVGVKFEGFWPSKETMEDAQKAYGKLFTPNFKWLSLGPDNPEPQAALDKAYAAFSHVCTEAELQSP